MLATASSYVLVNVDEHNAALLLALALLYGIGIYLLFHECVCGKCDHCRAERRRKDEEKLSREHTSLHQLKRVPGCPKCRENE